MARVYITIAILATVVTLSCSLPVHNNGDNSKMLKKYFSDSYGAKKIAVLDEIVVSDENRIIVPSTDVKSDIEGHIIVKRSPKAGVLAARNCPNEHFWTPKGCLPCNGAQQVGCSSGQAIDYSEIYDDNDNEVSS